jgi:hypothetical protein
MNYRIKASDVAAIVGLNPYKTREDVMNEYFKTPTKREKDFQEAFDQETPEVRQKIQETLKQSKTTDIPETPIVSDSVVITEYVKHEVYKNNGTHRESHVAETHGVTRDSKWYSLRISEDVRLVGIIDGRRGDSIVEIKNRQRRLFHKVPTYEYVQCQVYMKLTGVHKCILIESFEGASKEYPLEFSDAFWELEILPSLRQFAQELIEVPPLDDE